MGLSKKVLVEKIWDTHKPRRVRMKSVQCCLLACPLFTLCPRKEGSKEAMEILEHQRKVLEMDEVCKSAVGEDQQRVT